jgi:hypothetical protein
MQMRMAPAAKNMRWRYDVIASITLKRPAGDTLVIAKPFLTRSFRYSGSVRSAPPGPRSMLRSLKAFARSFASTLGVSGIKRSTRMSFPLLGNALRQFSRTLVLQLVQRKCRDALRACAFHSGQSLSLFLSAG